MVSLKTAIKRAGITQAELYRRTGVHWTTISRCISAKRWPAHRSTRTALMNALGLSEVSK